MAIKGKTHRARYARHGEYIGRYMGDENGAPCYRFEGGECHCFDADDRFASVEGNEWVPARKR
jgi:hypothetical protein